MSWNQTTKIASSSSDSVHLRPNSPLYYLDGVTVEFDRLKALDSLQLTINKGEIIFLTGSSGAGKTTLINVLAGNIIPDKGRLLNPVAKLRENHFIAEVFQDLRLLPNKSIEENLWVSYDPKIYKNRNDFYSDMVEICKVLGVMDRLHIKVTDANGGLKQKISMIRALLSKPSVLLADEPTSALDKDNSIKLFEVLNYYNTKRELTIVWATHNKDLVKQFSGRIVHLDKGKLVYTGHACFI